MKLRFVKFFTSRENEIEKKEGGGRRSTAITCSTTSQLARSHSPRFRSPLLSSSFPFFLPPPSPISPLLHHSSFSSVTGRESKTLQLSLPSCPASPFFLHKITEAEERGEKNRGGAPTLPTQLSYSTITGRAQLAAPCPFTKSGGCPPASVSRCDLSAAIGAIGKQRPKMRFPVLFPSLTNK